jgi:dCMP deaminase
MKWFKHWLKHAELISSMSPCPRARVGAFIIDKNNNPISAGFNGPPRKSSSSLCSDDHECARDIMKIESGTRTEIGCHHAEQNAIANAARKGVGLEGTTMIISIPPCLACAKLIHHAGIKSVGCSSTGYSLDGVEYLSSNNIKVFSLSPN